MEELNFEIDEVKEQIAEGIIELEPATSSKGTNNQTARAATQILVDKKAGFIVPTAKSEECTTCCIRKNWSSNLWESLRLS